jgi:hypothetical protein
MLDWRAEGGVVDNIIHTASTWSADLVVCVTEGRRGLLDAIRGSTVERLLRDAPAPLLIVPHEWGTDQVDAAGAVTRFAEFGVTLSVGAAGRPDPGAGPGDADVVTLWGVPPGFHAVSPERLRRVAGVSGRQPRRARLRFYGRLRVRRRLG